MASKNSKAPHAENLLDMLHNFEGMMKVMIKNGVTYHSFKEHITRLYVNAAVTMSDGNYCEASRKIGLHRNNVRSIMGAKKVSAYVEASQRHSEVLPIDE